MRSFRRLLSLCATLVVAVSCTDRAAVTEPPLEPSTVSGAALASVLNAAPVGYGDLASSYVGTSAASFTPTSFFLGGGMSALFDAGTMMGGGLASEFSGGISFGKGFANSGPFGGGLLCTGTYNAATGRVECPVQTINGLSITRSAAYATSAGAVQQAFDTVTTNSVNLQTKVTGSVVYDTTSIKRGQNGSHGWGMDRGPLGQLLGDTTTILSATTTVASVSARTTTGLAKGSASRTVNGTSSGTEATTGKSSRGAFTSSRVVGDTTKGLVVPVSTALIAITYPTAGTVIRQMKATITYAGQTPATTTRREVVTYNGSTTATIVVTENGVAKTCTRTLPFGRLVCP